jgi:NADPH-dependent FMN reductase
VEFVDIEPLPFVNTDLEKDGTYPPVVEAFRQKILEADCILFASPEYNYSVPGITIFALPIIFRIYSNILHLYTKSCRNNHNGIWFGFSSTDTEIVFVVETGLFDLR